MTPNLVSDRHLFRHTLAALAYRGTKTMRGASPGFATFKLDAATRTPVEIVAHLGDLFDWALSMAKGAQRWHTATPLVWDAEVARFTASLAAFDAYVASGAEVKAPLERLLQGPVADALTHVGQLAMLRRLAGEPIVGENYFVAHVAIGRLSLDQAPPVRTF